MGKIATHWAEMSQPTRMQLFMFAGYMLPLWVGGNPTIASVRALKRRDLVAPGRDGLLKLTRLGRRVANHGRDLLKKNYGDQVG